MPGPDDSLRKMFNASGFPFQIRVGAEIHQRFNERTAEWRIVGEEHRVVDPKTGEESFIDFIAQHGNFVLVIECKRLQESRYLFLEPYSREQVAPSKLLWSNAGQPHLLGWDEFLLLPRCPQTKYCINDRQPNSPNLLEKVASDLVRAAEALAVETMTAKNPVVDSAFAHIYVPVMITNAPLFVGFFETSDVDINSGQLPDDKGSFETFPAVKFRKSLSTAFPFVLPGAPPITSADPQIIISGDRESMNDRTVFVMNVSGFETAWPKLSIRGYTDQHVPWARARGQ